MDRLRSLLSPELWTARGASLLAGLLGAAVILVLGRIAAKLAANMVKSVLDLSETAKRETYRSSASIPNTTRSATWWLSPAGFSISRKSSRTPKSGWLPSGHNLRMKVTTCDNTGLTQVNEAFYFQNGNGYCAVVHSI